MLEFAVLEFASRGFERGDSSKCWNSFETRCFRLIVRFPATRPYSLTTFFALMRMKPCEDRKHHQLVLAFTLVVVGLTVARQAGSYRDLGRSMKGIDAT